MTLFATYTTPVGISIGTALAGLLVVAFLLAIIAKPLKATKETGSYDEI